jgi:hypothetical protein
VGDSIRARSAVVAGERPLRWNEWRPHLAVMIRMLGGKVVKENHLVFVIAAYILPILLILRVFHGDWRPASTILR